MTRNEIRAKITIVPKWAMSWEYTEEKKKLIEKRRKKKKNIFRVNLINQKLRMAEKVSLR